MDKEQDLRISLTDEEFCQALKIDRIPLYYFFMNALAYTALGLIFGLLLAAIPAFLLLYNMLHLSAVLSLSVAAAAITCAILLANYLGFHADYEIRPFYISFNTEWYTSWHEGRREKEIKGKTKNLSVEITDYGSFKGKKTVYFIKKGRSKYLYEGHNLNPHEIEIITAYCHKNKVLLKETNDESRD